MLNQIGQEGQDRLANAKVLVVGVGGLGSVVSMYLAGAGIGNIILVDSDVVSISNLQRQVLYTEKEVGMPKVECAARRLMDQNSNVRIETVYDQLCADNATELIGSVDLVMDCTDNFAVRFLIDDTCAALNKPWIYGSIGCFCGQVSVFGHTSGRRYSHLYPDRESLSAIPPSSAGVIGPVPGVIGSIQASEAIKLIAGFGQLLENKLFTIDLESLRSMVIDF